MRRYDFDCSGAWRFTIGHLMEFRYLMERTAIERPLWESYWDAAVEWSALEPLT